MIRPDVVGLVREHDEICELRQILGNQLTSLREEESEAAADELILGWRQLVSEVQELEDKATELRIELSGDAFRQIMSDPSFEVRDKDDCTDP
ncbi:hypothetical protein GC176_12350 [bacterium]|nr:hypothetical protein [bacterium]